jgi:signal transduction histidine kinase
MSLGVLTASIAHEVNQPLSGIITNASTCLRMLAVNPPKLDGARDTAQRIIRDGNRAADVISRLRALFTRSVGLIEEVDLNDAVREVISLCGNDLQRMRVSLHTDLTNELPLVSGDRVQLQQVVMNLLRNAADAMSGIEDRPRQLVVTTQSDGNEAVLLSVCDTGAGLAPDDVNRIFDAFFTTKSEGMGIGLSVSRTIIESHGGRLWAEANDGPGATFTFVIPSLSQDLVALPAPALLKAGQPADKAVKL